VSASGTIGLHEWPRSTLVPSTQLLSTGPSRAPPHS
jgi:hypothetical protein